MVAPHAFALSSGMAEQPYVIRNLQTGEQVEGSARDAYKPCVEIKARLDSGNYPHPDLQASLEANSGHWAFMVIEPPEQRERRAALDARRAAKAATWRRIATRFAVTVRNYTPQVSKAMYFSGSTASLRSSRAISDAQAPTASNARALLTIRRGRRLHQRAHADDLDPC